MSKHVTDIIARGQARIVEAPVAAEAPRHQVEVDRNFELPVSLYGVTVGLYFTFLGVMFAGFASEGLMIPMAIFAIFIVGMFGVPAIWTRLKSDACNTKAGQPMSAQEFEREGIMTYTGRLAPRDAAIQMLILPVLIVVWGCAVVIIAALA